MVDGPNLPVELSHHHLRAEHCLFWLLVGNIFTITKEVATTTKLFGNIFTRWNLPPPCPHPPHTVPLHQLLQPIHPETQRLQSISFDSSQFNQKPCIPQLLDSNMRTFDNVLIREGRPIKRSNPTSTKLDSTYVSEQLVDWKPGSHLIGAAGVPPFPLLPHIRSTHIRSTFSRTKCNIMAAGCYNKPPVMMASQN